MKIDLLKSFVEESLSEIPKYKLNFILSQPNIMKSQYVVSSLNWDSISYGEQEIEKIPDDKRGVYAFAVCQRSTVLPLHSYILYIGIAGHDSERSLRNRYKDYLNQRKVIKRERIARMIGTWHDVLRFFFAPVNDDVSSDDLKKLERQLNTALMPPFSINDLDAETKRKRRAFE